MEAADPAATPSRFDIRFGPWWGIETEASRAGHTEASDPQPTDGGECDEIQLHQSPSRCRQPCDHSCRHPLSSDRVVYSFDAWIAPLDRESAGDDPSWRAKGARSGEAWLGWLGDDGHVSEGAHAI